jgi:hypothetical protein
MIKDMAESMTLGYRKLNDLFSQTIIEQFGRTNKIHSKRILEDYKAVIKVSKLHGLIPLYCDTLTNKIKHKNNVNVRASVADCLLSLIEANNEVNISKYQSIIERTIQTAALDPNPNVRAIVRQCYHAYGEKVPKALVQFEMKLAPQQLKYLHQSPSPSPTQSGTLVPSTSSSKTINTKALPKNKTIATFKRNTDANIASVNKISISNKAVHSTSRTHNIKTTTQDKSRTSAVGKYTTGANTTSTSNRVTDVSIIQPASTTKAVNEVKGEALVTTKPAINNVTASNISTSAATANPICNNTPTTSINAAASNTNILTTRINRLKTATTHKSIIGNISRLRADAVRSKSSLSKNKALLGSLMAKNKTLKVRGLVDHGNMATNSNRYKVKKVVRTVKPLNDQKSNNTFVSKSTIKTALSQNKKRPQSEAFEDEENNSTDKRLREGVGGRGR